jgi:very-short-patch-repair endonuclease
MDPVRALERLGGFAGRAKLLELTSRRRLRKAVADGRVLRLARGRYGHPGVALSRRSAAALSGVVALRSAAQHYEWELKEQPAEPEVAIGTKRKIAPDRRQGIRVLWVDLPPSDVVDSVTTPIRTLVDCARRLPFDEALAVADSALRSGNVTRSDLERVEVRGAGAERVRRVLSRADGRSANPFESVLRALCVEAGLVVVPQAPVELPGGTVHPDLVSASARVVLEADSWTFHASRKAHRADCARYNALTLARWRVLRFTWEQVMHQQGYVRWVLRELVGGPERQEEVEAGGLRSA